MAQQTRVTHAERNPPQLTTSILTIFEHAKIALGHIKFSDI